MPGDKSPVYEVQAIVDEDYSNPKERVFLIRWAGYSAEHDSWEPLSHLEGGAGVLIKKWDRRKARLLEKEKVKKEDDDGGLNPLTNYPQKTGTNNARGHTRAKSSTEVHSFVVPPLIVECF
jgi:Chromo (CHRromatin Organisation MOdifier) domain